MDEQNQVIFDDSILPRSVLYIKVLSLLGDPTEKKNQDLEGSRASQQKLTRVVT